jgi:hypothetical protein
MAEAGTEPVAAVVLAASGAAAHHLPVAVASIVQTGVRLTTSFLNRLLRLCLPSGKCRLT